MVSPVFGRHGAYHWVEVIGVLFEELLTAVPEIVRGRYVAIVAYDSGPFAPNRDERAAGWRVAGDVVWTSRIVDPMALPFEEYDEWYVFDAPRDDFAPTERFISYLSFRLTNPSERERRDAAGFWTAPVLAELPVLQTRFWEQVERFNAVSVLAQNDWRSLIVTRDPSVSRQIAEWASGYGKSA